MYLHSQIRYARSNNTSIAYQQLGSGKHALILINGWVSNLEEGWNLPGVAEWLTDLAGFTRLIIFDKRGVGLSDRVADHQLPSLQERMDDLRAIMDQENIQKATLFGFSEGGPMAIQFSATFPERVESLILYGSYACLTHAADYSIGLPAAFHLITLQAIDRYWGQAIGLPLMAPSVANEPLYQKAWASFLRKSASPKAAKLLYQMNISLDVRNLLASIQLPVLVLHREADKLIPLPLGRYLAEHIPGAKLITFPGADHFPWIGDSQAITLAISMFMGKTYQPSSQTTSVGTIAAIKISPDYPQNYLTGLLQQEGSLYTIASPEVLLGLFDNPQAALSILQRILANHTSNHQPIVAIHSGVYTRNGSRIEGPFVSWLLDILPALKPGYIWLTQAARTLLSTLAVDSFLMQEIDLPDHALSIRVYACARSYTQSEPYQLVLHKGKLREQDVSTLLNIRRYLEEHYLSPLTISFISRTFAINTFKLKYGFKALFTSTVIQYVQALRLEHARQLIMHTQMPIGEIADLVGYRQAGNFSKAFGKKYGTKATDLRKTEADLVSQ